MLSVLNPILRAREVVVKAGVTDSFGENDEKKKKHDPFEQKVSLTI